MALESIKNINVDFYDNRYILINAKQYDDSSRWISVTCYNQGSIFNLSSSKHTAYIRYRKADGHTVFNFCTINTRGQILVELTEQMLAASGICDADLVIVNKGNAIVDVDTGEIIVVDNSAIISTMVFRVNVYEASIDNSLVESSDEFNLLNSKLKDYWADFENVVKTAKSWAVGGTGINGRSEIEDVDNAKYYSQLSKSYAIGDASNTRENEDADNSKFYCNRAETAANKSEDNFELSKSYAIGNTGVRDGENTDNSKYYSEQSNISKNKSLEYATTSQRYAVGGTNSVENEETDNSKYYYEQSLDNKNISEQNKDSAMASASAASASELIASQKADSASGSATSANASATSAANDAIRAETAADKVENIEANIEVSLGTISDSVISASESASSASASAKIASDSENAILENKAYIDDVAIEIKNNKDTVASNTETTIEKAQETYVYYQQINEIVTGLSGAFMPMGTIEFVELATLVENGEVKAGYLYNISDNFVTDETFKRGTGIEYAAGTNVYRTSDGYWDCLTSTTVTGVKGGNETEYRKGNVNITVENIGAVASADIATVDEVKEFLGI